MDPNSTLTCTTVSVSSPPWVSLSGYRYTFTPDETILGDFQVFLNITDGVNYQPYNFTVSVMPPNNLPAFRQPLENQTMKEGQRVIYNMPDYYDPEDSTIIIGYS